MGEESIAQKPHTRTRGTEEDGRKRKRTAGGKRKGRCAHRRAGNQAGNKKAKRRKNPKYKKQNIQESERGEKKKKTLLLHLQSEPSKKIQGKSLKHPEKMGFKAVKEKASELLCVHQSIMQPDGQKHMLRVPFQSYINSPPCPSL